MKPLLVVLALALVSGCAYQAKGSRLDGAPVLPPSPFAKLIYAVPTDGAVEIGRVQAQGNNYQKASDCDAQLLVEARKLGANAVLAIPEKSGFGKGPKCSGRAFLVEGLTQP